MLLSDIILSLKTAVDVFKDNCTTARKRKETSDDESGELGKTPGRHAGWDVLYISTQRSP